MPWGAAIAAVGAVAGSVLSSKSQEKAADKQADAIKDAQGISSEASNQARSDALALFNPAFNDISQGMQNARNDLLDGRASAQDILNQSFSQASNTLQTSNQQAMNAILGTPQASSFRGGQPSMSSRQPSSLRQATTRPTTGGYKPQQQDMSRDTSQMRQLADVRNLASEGALSQNRLDKQYGMSDSTSGMERPDFVSPTQGREFFPQGAQTMGPEQFPQTGIPTGEMPALEGEFIPAGMPDSGFQAGAPQGNYGLSGAESALRDMVGLQEGVIDEAAGAGLGYFEPYRGAGEGAVNLEAAFTGALGPEAQAEAFANYSESPGQKFSRERQEQSLLRNQSATGGLGGGNILTALQEQAAGIASQNYNQDLSNLRSLAGRGQQAAGSSAGLEQWRGGGLSNVYGQAGGALSNLRYGAGQDIAQQLGMTGQQLAQLQSGQGTALANIDQSTGANLANISAQQGGATSDLRTSLAALLSNLATGQGTQQANLAMSLGGAQAAGVTNPWGNAASTFAGMAASNPNMFTNAFGSTQPAPQQTQPYSTTMGPPI